MLISLWRCTPASSCLPISLVVQLCSLLVPGCLHASVTNPADFSVVVQITTFPQFMEFVFNWYQTWFCPLKNRLFVSSKSIIFCCKRTILIISNDHLSSPWRCFQTDLFLYLPFKTVNFDVTVVGYWRSLSWPWPRLSDCSSEPFPETVYFSF